MIFFRYRAHLETELLRQEQLYKLCLAVKEKVIQRQDDEIKMLRAKLERFELLVIPGLRPAATTAHVKPRQVEPEGETGWSSYLKQHIAEEEKLAAQAKEQANGVSLKERPGVHQPSSGNAGGQNGGSTARTAPATSGNA